VKIKGLKINDLQHKNNRVGMIDKIGYTLKKRSFSRLLTTSINSFLIRLFGVRIIKYRSIAGNHTARKVFSKCTLNYSDDGFYYLNPMPSNDELNLYYSSLYWDSRSGKNYGVNTRDIIHYKILNDNISEILSDGKVFLNFGAGHGGISNLFWLAGMQIINIEPSSLPEFYSERWITLKDIKQVENSSIDVIYGSHSLEHVQNIEAFKLEGARILKPGGFVFWEVPNSDCPDNGAQKGIVDIPHTYYFETKFFNNWFSRSLLCSGFEISQNLQDWQNFKDDKGSVIRALGQIK